MPPQFVESGRPVRHPLEVKFNAPAWDILSVIERGFRAQVDVKGKLAEWFLGHAGCQSRRPGRVRPVTAVSRVEAGGQVDTRVLVLLGGWDV